MIIGEDRPRVHLIASLGGHLELLNAIAPVLAGHSVTWITSEGSRAESLRAGGHAVRALPRLDRGSLRPSAVAAGVALALRERPTLVVTSGAGLAVPFAVTSRLLGARLIFIETMARVRSGSASGRLLGRLGAAMFVQWPELLHIHPTATVCRPTLLEGVGVEAAAGGGGTFVTVGSHDAAFDRLLEAVDAAAERGLLPLPVTVQSGVSDRRPRHGTAVDFMPPERFGELMHDADLVITHAGAGAIATALRHGKVPLVMARSAERGEHVDDHQAELLERLDRMGLVIRIEDAIGEAEIDQARRSPAVIDPETAAYPTVAEALSAHLGIEASKDRPAT